MYEHSGPLKVRGGVVVVAHKILVTSPEAKFLFFLFGALGFGLGLGLSLSIVVKPRPQSP